MAGAVGGVAGPTDRGLAVLGRVAAEAALVDLALGGAVERQAHVLEVEDGVDRLLRQDLGGVLVDEVVAALDGVEGVPLPVVVLDVGERGGHAALGRAGVRAGRVELRDDGGAGVRPGLDRGAHPRAPGADDDDVVLVVVDAVDDGVLVGRGGSGGSGHSSFRGTVVRRRDRSRRRWSSRRGGQAEQMDGSMSAGALAGHGSNVQTTRVPRRSRTAAETTSVPSSTRRTAGRPT